MHPKYNYMENKTENSRQNYGLPPQLEDQGWGKPAEEKRSSLLHHLIVALVIVLAVCFGMIVSSFKQDKYSKALQQENELLKDKLQLYEDTIESINKKLNLDKASPESRNYPYYSGKSKSAAKGRLVLKQRMNSLESKMITILDILNGESSYAFGGDDGDKIPSIFPTFGRFTEYWGSRIHPITRRREFHYGIDIANKTGTAVYATAAGEVVKCDYDSGYGKRILIDHGNGYQTLYAHLYNYRVRKGDQVKKGQLIALMGNTGVSTGPHLHYEVHLDKQKLNPSAYLNRTDGYAYRR